MGILHAHEIPMEPTKKYHPKQKVPREHYAEYERKGWSYKYKHHRDLAFRRKTFLPVYLVLHA